MVSLETRQLVEKPRKQERRYLSHLLRLWLEDAGDPPGSERPRWRASLESPQSGELQGFASLEVLFAFLVGQTGSSTPGSDKSDEIGSA
jgi:hypothetical protein